MASDAQGELLVAQLGKKSSFAGAVGRLSALAEEDAAWAGSPSAVQAARRCMQLLRARYTSPSFWSRGAALIEAVLRAEGHSRQHSELLAGWLQECSCAAAERQAGASAAQPAAPSVQTHSLFEGQLSRVRRRALCQAAGHPHGPLTRCPLQEEPTPALPPLEELLQRVLAGQQAERPDLDGDAGEAQQHPQTMQHGLFAGRLRLWLLAALHEALIRSLVDEGDQPSAPPPAAKYAVKDLKAYGFRRRPAPAECLQCCVCQCAPPSAGWALPGPYGAP